VQSAYRGVDRYKKLIPKGITQSVKMLKIEDLRSRSQELADDYMDSPRKEAIERFKALTATGLASRKTEEVLASAGDGRVDTLFTLQPAETPWSLGGVHATEEELKVIETANRDNEIANAAALATLSNHGRVFKVGPEEIPLEGPIAAIYRY